MTLPERRDAVQQSAQRPGAVPPRVVIENIRPAVDCGRFAPKRIAGERIRVEADIFADSADALNAEVTLRRPDGSRVPLRMTAAGNDRWAADVPLGPPGAYSFAIEAWVSSYASWLALLQRRNPTGPDFDVELLEGATLLCEAAASAPAAARRRLEAAATELCTAADPLAVARAAQADAMQHEPRRAGTRSPDMPLTVDPPHAGFSAWYEFFPRSFGDGARLGTFREAMKVLDHVADLGFDTVYLPPIHPIGRSGRKGPNGRQDLSGPGSPWAIGAREGGHTAIAPELGTLDDFRAFVEYGRSRGLRIALDIAFQASPDHPLLREHPGWFRRRADGSIRTAENPPKRYDDIVPFDFENDDWLGLWHHLRDVVLFWVDQGVTTFRVDNPHTKPFAFWEWLIAEVKHREPNAVFLSEAFTRPAVMRRLAKLGFTQSYTYFTWKNSKWELEEYLRELEASGSREYFRTNFWPNTPDILHEYLQEGGEPAFAIRAALAATLSANWGVYGPAYEAAERRAREPGSEEYLDSEKFQLRRWDLPGPMSGLLRTLNAVRRAHPALQRDDTLALHFTNSDDVICYSKSDPRTGDRIIVAVLLNPHRPVYCDVAISTSVFGLPDGASLHVTNVLNGDAWTWDGGRASLHFDPVARAFMIFAAEPVEGAPW